MRCAVVGAGAWGTALADVLARNGHETMLWAREPDVADSINDSQENRRFLAGARLDSRLVASSDLARALSARPELVVFAPPSQVLRRMASECRALLDRSSIAVVASKGIELDTFALMTTVVESELGGNPVVALSGPSFAAEVAARQPTAVVAASVDPAAALATQQAFSAQEFRVYTNDDVTGVELGGSLKNVMAVATGICEGLGLGFNTRAALITRGLAEMTRLGARLGARPETFAGLAGIGDLVLTCTGSLSRNRALGAEIGRGRTLDEALAGKETVAEGVITTRSTFALAQREGVEMPIVEAVHRTLFDGLPPRQSITALMARELRPETD
jgi:glycerol-3-phosphate dehydrogenase (NAD(P)+)